MNTVELRCSKIMYYTGTFYEERAEWLDDNIGLSFQGADISDMELKNNWYSSIAHDNDIVIMTYTFKDHADAMWFSLRWS